jgi:hypothetical protein
VSAVRVGRAGGKDREQGIGNREWGMGNWELVGCFLGAGCCNIHMRGTRIDTTFGRRFGTGQDVAFDREKDTL